MARRVVVGDLRVQRLDRRNGLRSWTIVWPEGTVHEEADRFLRVHDGSGTQKTYAYYLVDHLRWLDRECLPLEGVRLRDLERYMGIVGADVRMPLGEPWRTGKRPYGRAALSTAAACLKGFYLHQSSLGINTELGETLGRTRLPARADRRRALLGHVKTEMPANPLAPRGRYRRHPKMLPDGARESMLEAVSSARDRLIVSWLADGGLRIGELCGLHLVDLHLRQDAACGECRWPHLHVCHRPGNPNGAEAKTKHPWETGGGTITGGLVKRVSPAMIHSYFEYLTGEYPRESGHGMLLVQLHGPSAGQPLAPAGARASNGACPQYQAARARPGLWPARRAPSGQPGLTHFSLDPVMALLDLVEHDGLTLEQALAQVRDGRTEVQPHEGLLRWGAHGAAQYLSAGSAVDAGSGWAAVPVSRSWVMQVKPPDGGTIYELCAWGRRYESADGKDRELRLPRVKSVKDRAVDLGEAAAAAMVLAYGAVALNQSRSGKPHNLREARPIRSVRVVEVGCEDGSWQEMFSGSPQEARLSYDEHAKARLGAVTSGGEYRPGDDCAGCKLAGTCPALPSRPGLLGIIGTGPVRTWSVTNGRHYEDCPAQDYLERLHLPRGPRTEPSGAVRRGQAVHAWLASRHERPGAAPCSAEDVPESPDAWSAGCWEVTGEEARLGVQMIGDHSLTCALEDLPQGVPAGEHALGGIEALVSPLPPCQRSCPVTAVTR